MGDTPMSDGLGNIRLALRTLGRNRTFATIAVLSLGVAIALNTTVYALIDAMVAPQLDVRQPEQVFFIKLYADGHRLTPRALDDAFHAGLHGYEGVTGFRRLGDHVAVEHGSHVHDASAVVVRPDFFAVVGIRPMAGRVLGPADEGSPVAIISDRLAAQLFPTGESALGEAIDVDGRRQTIVGVVRWDPRFYLANYDLWILPNDSDRKSVV